MSSYLPRSNCFSKYELYSLLRRMHASLIHQRKIETSKASLASFWPTIRLSLNAIFLNSKKFCIKFANKLEWLLQSVKSSTNSNVYKTFSMFGFTRAMILKLALTYSINNLLLWVSFDSLQFIDAKMPKVCIWLLGLSLGSTSSNPCYFASLSLRTFLEKPATMNYS